MYTTPITPCFYSECGFLLDFTVVGSFMMLMRYNGSMVEGWLG